MSSIDQPTAASAGMTSFLFAVAAICSLGGPSAVG